MLQLKHYLLPHDGVIPGARGWKKQVIPAGTKVWCIVYGTRIYHYCYLNETQAETVRGNLEGWMAKTNISRETVLAFNFSPSIPRRVVREKVNAS